MYLFRRYATSRFFFSTSKSDKCKTSSKMVPYLKDIFINNMKDIEPLIYNYDIRFTSLVAQNLFNFNIQHKELQTALMTNATHRDQDLTPQLAIDLAISFKHCVDFKTNDVYEILYDYIDQYYYLFDTEQLNNLEILYYYLSRKLLTPFVTDFKNLIEVSRIATSDTSKEQAQELLSSFGVEIPEKDIRVVLFPKQNIIRLSFIKLGKSLTLKGISDNDLDPVKQLRDVFAQKQFDFFLLGLPSITNKDVYAKKHNRQYNTGINKIVNEDLHIQDIQKDEVRHPYLDLFKKYGRMAYMDGSLLGWYKDNILNNETLYQPEEIERMVYTDYKGFRRVDQLQSVLYSLSMKKDKNFKVLLSDMDIFDEISIIAEDTTLEDVRDLFDYVRFMWLQEMINWGIRATKNGCLNCSKTNKKLPNNIFELVSKARYKFAVRETFIAFQIVRAIKTNQETKTYLGLYPSYMLNGILSKVCEIIKVEGSTSSINEANNKANNNEEERFQQYIRSVRKAETTAERSQTSNKNDSGVYKTDEYTEKIAIISTINELAGRKMNIDIINEAGIDHDLFHKLKKEYAQMLCLSSFSGQKKNKWGDIKEYKGCYASNLIFN